MLTIGMKGKKAAGLLCSLALLGGLLAGCGDGNNGNNGNAGNTGNAGESTGEKTEAPFKITFMAPFFNAQPPQMDNNPALERLEELTNTDIEINWVANAGNVYLDKSNVSLASNSLPMVFVAPDPKSSVVVNAVRSGVFWEVGPYLDEFPNLKAAFNEITLNNASIDGKVYGLYRPRALARVGFLIRQDWLDNLGLQAPTTQEEIYNVAKAFTENDPDQNGQKDTYGYGFLNDPFWGGLLSFAVPNGSPNGWGVKDGKFTPDYATQEYSDALDFIRKLYADGFIHPDFATPGYNNSQMFDTGKIGMFTTAYDDIRQRSIEVVKANPDAKITIVGALEGSAGELTPATSGYAGLLMFPKNAVKTEGDLKKILAFYDRTFDQDVIDLFAFGVEGVHHSLENGAVVITNDEGIKNDVDPFTQLLVRPAWIDFESDTPPVKEYKKYYDDFKDKVVPNAADPYISQTQVERGPELKKLLDDARVKYILGDSDQAEYQQVVQSVLEKGGNQIIEELTSQLSE